MKSRSVIAVHLLLSLAFLAPAANAQSRLALEVGPLFPVGDLADSHDTSLYLGARWEMQDVNALGQAARLSYFVRAGYGVMSLDGGLESQLEALGQSTSTSFLDAGVGVRVYSTQAPVFVSAGAGYANFDGGGDADSENGFGAALGIGLSKDVGDFFLEIEGRGNLVIIDPDNIEFFTLLAGFGLPF